MIAAIGTDGNRPVVWGLGRTEKSARRDADSYEGWRDGGWACIKVSASVVRRVLAGTVDCESLGITVRVRDGLVTDADCRLAGRPTRKSVASTIRIELRATPDEVVGWRERARAAGLSLSAWIRLQIETNNDGV